jgi:hypothetical protein
MSMADSSARNVMCVVLCSSAVPWVTSGPEDVAGALHQGLALDCEVKGYPIPGVHWEFQAENGNMRVLPSKCISIMFKEISSSEGVNERVRSD